MLFNFIDKYHRKWIFSRKFQNQFSTDAEVGQDVCLGTHLRASKAHTHHSRTPQPQGAARRCWALDLSRRGMSSSGGGGGRYMAFSPSPSAPHSPHLSGLRSAASTALLEQEKYTLTLRSFFLFFVSPVLIS